MFHVQRHHHRTTVDQKVQDCDLEQCGAAACLSITSLHHVSLRPPSGSLARQHPHSAALGRLPYRRKTQTNKEVMSCGPASHYRAAPASQIGRAHV